MRRFLPFVFSTLLAIPAPATAQGEDFYVQLANSALRELGKEMSTVNGLRADMRVEQDSAAGCRLLGSLIYHLEEEQRILERFLDYMDKLGDVESYNLAVTDYNNLIEDLNDSRDDYDRLCT